MTLTARTVASGAGWPVSDIRRDAGLADAPYEEQHDRFCMAVARIVIGTRADGARFARIKSAASEYFDRAAA
jgi:hypothetical protein